MDILKKLPFQTLENFIIRVGAIEHGWILPLQPLKSNSVI